MSRFTMPLDVMLFEFRRSMTLGRIAVWALLVLFPIAIFTTMTMIARSEVREGFDPEQLMQQFGLVLYFLVAEVSVLLGLLLWATPAISTEIEGQTWVYLTLRRSGRTMVLIGKYLTAVAWTSSAALISISVCYFVLGWFGADWFGIEQDAAFELWKVLCVIAVLSSIVHAALYVLIGAVFYRRTMVAAVFYTLLVEGAVSFIPALINKATINYRLRGLLANWMEWDDARSQAENVFGSESASTHLLALLMILVLFMSISLWKVETTEYPTQQEGS